MIVRLVMKPVMPDGGKLAQLLGIETADAAAQKALEDALGESAFGALKLGPVASVKKADCEALRRALYSSWRKLLNTKRPTPLSDETRSALTDALVAALNELQTEEDKLSKGKGGRPLKSLGRDLARRLAVVLIEHNRRQKTDPKSVTSSVKKFRDILERALRVYLPDENLGAKILNKIASEALANANAQKRGKK